MVKKKEPLTVFCLSWAAMALLCDTVKFKFQHYTVQPYVRSGAANKQFATLRPTKQLSYNSAMVQMHDR
jgi:hypothetical protein